MKWAARGVLGALLLASAITLPLPAAEATPSEPITGSASTPAGIHMTPADEESGGSSLYHALVAPTSFSDVRFVLPSDHQMFVSDADAVHVINDQGDVVRTITDIPTATGLAISADGTTLFAAEESAAQIVGIDVASGMISTTFTVAPCPQQLAVIGSVLFYTAGCSSTGMISHVNLSTGVVSTNPDQTLQDSQALLAATSDTLFTSDGRLRSWGVTTDINGEPVYSAESDGSYFPHVMSLVAHDQDVVVMDAGINGYGLYRPDLGGAGFISTVSYPTAVAWSADGSHIAAGSDTPRGNSLRVISTADSTVGVQAAIPSLKGLDGNQAVFPGALMYSADESRLVALTRECSGSTCSYAIAQASTSAPLPSTVTVRVTGPRTYGEPSHIEVHSPGRPGVSVLVTVANGSWHSSRSVTTNSGGVGLVNLVIPYSSAVTAHLAGDLQHEDARPQTVAVRIPAAFAVTLGRGVRVLHGVVHYGRLSDMRQRVLLNPRKALRMVKVTLQYRAGAKWFSAKPFTVYTDATGYVNTVMRQARRNVLYRIIYAFAGDAWNTSATQTSGLFILN